jgi:hypothetical protein
MRPASILPRDLPAKHASLESKAADPSAQNHHDDRIASGAAGAAPSIESQPGAPASPKPTYEELRQLVALYDHRPAPRRRRVARAVIIGLIFVVGTATGIGAASWLRAQQGPALRNLSTDMPKFPAHRNGISEGELPYDGSAAGRNVHQVLETARGLNPVELPYGGEPRPGAAAVQAGQVDSASSSLAAEVPPEHASQADTGMEAPSSAATREKQVKQSVSPSEKKGMPVQAHRQKSSRRADKDKEIQRIRQQAEEELKKKPESARRGGEARNAAARAAQEKGGRSKSASRSSGAATMTAMLQQCEQAGNIISREYCKWQLCSGKWGKSGCPSYPPHGSLN